MSNTNPLTPAENPARAAEQRATLKRIMNERNDPNLIIFEAETGEQVRPFIPATGEVWGRIAATCLPGVTVEQVDAFYSAIMEPVPFAVGTLADAVGSAYRKGGTVTARAESEGELHTIWVRWPGEARPFIYSPVELRVAVKP